MRARSRTRYAPLVSPTIRCTRIVACNGSWASPARAPLRRGSLRRPPHGSARLGSPAPARPRAAPLRLTLRLAPAPAPARLPHPPRARPTPPTQARATTAAPAPQRRVARRVIEAIRPHTPIVMIRGPQSESRFHWRVKNPKHPYHSGNTHAGRTAARASFRDYMRWSAYRYGVTPSAWRLSHMLIDGRHTC